MPKFYGLIEITAPNADAARNQFECMSLNMGMPASSNVAVLTEAQYVAAGLVDLTFSAKINQIIDGHAVEVVDDHLSIPRPPR